MDKNKPSNPYTISCVNRQLSEENPMTGSWRQLNHTVVSMLLMWTFLHLVSEHLAYVWVFRGPIQDGQQGAGREHDNLSLISITE
jgi:hypothetical protein